MELTIRLSERGWQMAAAPKTTALPVQAKINVADDLAESDVFLTVTGTSAEAGGDGEAGRGNRVSGLITPYRAMTVEAAAGKNPISHAGKLYNLPAMRIAGSIAADCQGIDAASCIIGSQIGRAIDDPQLLDVDLVGSAELPILERSVGDIVHAELQRMRAIGDELLAERLPVFTSRGAAANPPVFVRIPTGLGPASIHASIRG